MTTILLVDDDDTLADTLTTMLRRSGYDVMRARDGKEAFRLLSLETFDLVLTDVVMPNMDGFELIMKVRQLHADITFIAMSGSGPGGLADYLRIARHLGAGQVLEKPF